MDQLSADEIISVLQLQPHPEGGFYRETFRDTENMRSDGRAASTAIYYLLRAGEVSRWHRIDAAEIWHYYAGATLELSMDVPGEGKRSFRLGSDLKNGAYPQVVVPKGFWQQSRSLGAFTLVGCTVAPGFEFSGFEMADEGIGPGQGTI